jgi:zinc protease
MHRARAELVRSIPLSESSLSGIGHGLLYYSTHDLPLNEPIRAARHYVALNAKDVREAYRKWIRPHDLVQVTQGPSPK